MEIKIPYCVLFACRRLREINVGPAEPDVVPVRLKCAAFPEGVPVEIIDGQATHETLRGDEAEPVKLDPADDAASVFRRFDDALGIPRPKSI